MRHVNKAAIGLCAAVLLCGAASAQLETGFEPPTYSGSAGGVVMTGQDGWYLPSGVDYNVYTYAGNVLGVNANPQGGEQFVAGVGPGTDYARAQHDLNWADLTEWTVTYDVAALYDGLPPGANNLGSFSVQPSTDTIGSYVHLFSWVDLNDPVDFNAFFLHYDAAGTQVAQPGSSPGPEFGGLELNHWYRFSTTLDFLVNQITEVSILDLTGGGSATYEPVDWYLSGGAAGGDPTVTALRFFAGGGVAGNTLAWDNLGVIPEPGSLCGIALLGLVLARRRG
jgi:hypothetical protein